jgi:hypothetical protein
MIVLASDFSGLAPLVCILPVAGVLGAVSFYPAWRGHWSAPLLATPLLIVGLLAIYALRMNAAAVRLGDCLVLLSPLVVAVTSFGLFVARMRVRRARARETER